MRNLNWRIIAIAILAIIAIAIIAAATGYIITADSNTSHREPIPGNSSLIDPYGPEPISTNTGFQTGDNDAPVKERN